MSIGTCRARKGGGWRESSQSRARRKEEPWELERRARGRDRTYEIRVDHAEHRPQPSLEYCVARSDDLQELDGSACTTHEGTTTLRQLCPFTLHQTHTVPRAEARRDGLT